MIIDVLTEKINKRQNPTVVGLDPQLEFIPGSILSRNIQRYGKTLKAAAAAAYEFNKEIIDNVYDIVAAVKPQIAMYEQFGYEGVKCYAKTIEYAKTRGLIVIGDIKRSDIASTAACYSKGHIGSVKIEGSLHRPFLSDFITLNPYLGEDSITPFLDDCKENDKGIFILVKTSNPGGGLFQDIMSEGKPLYLHVAAFVQKTAQGLMGNCGYSNICAVAGATYPKQLAQLREAMPNVFLLIPGYGAQGGTAQDIKPAFDKNGYGAIINSSRAIIAAYKLDKYKDKYKETEFAAAARTAALEMKDQLNSVL